MWTSAALREENLRLQRDAAILQRRIGQLEEQALETQRLQGLLGHARGRGARVRGGPGGGEGRHQLVQDHPDRPRKPGRHAAQPAGGRAGRPGRDAIVDVTPSSAKVQLVTDPVSAAGGLMQRTRVTGIVIRQPGRRPEGTVPAAPGRRRGRGRGGDLGHGRRLPQGHSRRPGHRRGADERRAVPGGRPAAEGRPGPAGRGRGPDERGATRRLRNGEPPATMRLFILGLLACASAQAALLAIHQRGRRAPRSLPPAGLLPQPPRQPGGRDASGVRHRPLSRTPSRAAPWGCGRSRTRLMGFITASAEPRPGHREAAGPVAGCSSPARAVRAY
ncbi:MAG: hypothetical protein MZV63_33835 [Marinilabiliales bacterium]|nr:hypothetical protein [Marinilabiliales bacterium]